MSAAVKPFSRQSDGGSDMELFYAQLLKSLLLLVEISIKQPGTSSARIPFFFECVQPIPSTLAALMWSHDVFPVVSWTLLSYLLIQFAIATPNPLQAGPLQCDKAFYGSPKIEDCNQAIFWIPKRNPNADSSHIFAEPQLLNPPFNAVKNPMLRRLLYSYQKSLNMVSRTT